MADCKECRGQGTKLVAGRFADGSDDRDVTCWRCEGSGKAGCVYCGEPSRDADRFCSDTCKADDAAADARAGVTP
jgi:DnaJ-class molecular chaperone